MFWKGERSGGQSVQKPSGAGGLWWKHTILSSLPASGDTWWADFSWSSTYSNSSFKNENCIIYTSSRCEYSMTYFPL